MVIKNFALIENAEIDFTNDLNIITGETGSGKSIILSSLKFLFGERASSSIIRTGEDECQVSLSFKKTPSIGALLKKSGNETDSDFILVRRTLKKSGLSKFYVNDSQVSQSFCRELGEKVIFCSQFENQKLLDKKNILDIVDLFLDDLSIKNEYKDKYSEYLETNKIIDDNRLLSKDKDIRLDYLKFVLDEIEKISPKEKEDVTLEEEIKKAKESEKINTFFLESENIIYGEDSIISKLEKIKSLSKNINYGLGIEQDLNSLISLAENFGDKVLKSKKENLKKTDINKIQDRLSKIKSLTRKYGGSIESVIKKRIETKNEILLLESFEARLFELEQKKAALVKKLDSISGELSLIREKICLTLDNKISTNLNKLNMPGAKVQLIVSKTSDFTPTGKNEIEIIFTPNVGEKALPLDKMASGGELSRITLAIYGIIGRHIDSEMFVFDEIDTGIGGETALVVGEELSSLSKKSQVLVVTHLPQIAEFANNHICVKKVSKNSRTFTTIKQLAKSEIENELNRMRFGKIKPKA